MAHIAGLINTAAENFSRLEPKVTEIIRLEIRERKHITPIEVTASFSEVADEWQFFFTHADSEKESEEQFYQRKKNNLGKMQKIG